MTLREVSGTPCNEDNRGLAAELLSPLLTAPRMTLSRLVHVAAKHSSQARAHTPPLSITT